MDIKDKAIWYWQDRLAKFFPRSKGPTNTEIDMFRAGYHKAQSEAAGLAEALELIASPQRPDGTWNRDRKACMELARNALKGSDVGEAEASADNKIDWLIDTIKFGSYEASDAHFMLKTVKELESELDAALMARAILKTDNNRLREALEEIAKPPYKDSDLRSLMAWVNSRARAALEGK